MAKYETKTFSELDISGGEDAANVLMINGTVYTMAKVIGESVIYYAPDTPIVEQLFKAQEKKYKFVEFASGQEDRRLAFLKRLAAKIDDHFDCDEIMLDDTIEAFVDYAVSKLYEK